VNGFKASNASCWTTFAQGENMLDKKSNLKKCPFCGGKPELKGRGGYWWVACACGITTAKSNASDAEDWQVYLWNRRPTQTVKQLPAQYSQEVNDVCI